MRYMLAVCLLALIALPWMIIRAQKAQRVESENLQRALDAVLAQEESRSKADTARLDELQRDPEVRMSILEGLRVTVARPREARTSVRVDIEKPLGTRFLIDDVERSCTLFLDGKVLARFSGDGRDVRVLLDRTVGSSHRFLRLGQDVPEGGRLEVEWRNRNPRTGQTEALRVSE